MQHAQASTAPVPRPRPAKPDYTGVFLEPAVPALEEDDGDFADQDNR